MEDMKGIENAENMHNAEEDIESEEIEDTSSPSGFFVFTVIMGFVMFIVSAVFLHKGHDKMCNYSTGYFKQNAYVGGDAYNYIINSNYSTSFFVLATLFALLGVGIIIIGYLHRIAIKNND
ncbi:hypothetical protein PV797_04020 [Clostridiaceae bacterium M8S5]|nr:hypothetical protein PV797_04020 [Clostridiaceae bacterium M8S5]